MRLIVIGGVAAGMSAASRARRLDPSLEIVVLEKSEHVSYGACGLPYFLQGKVSLEDLQVHDAAFFERNRNIRVRLRTEAAAISHPRREVVLTSGEKLRYDKLVIATGARREAYPGAYRLDPWTEAERLAERLEERSVRSAAVLGAGYIGLEAAEALRARGLAVTVHEASNDVLGREDGWLTSRIAAHLERCRITLHRNSRDARADIVIQACGLKPNNALAVDAGLELGAEGAIRVDERMETSFANVYAAGDCAESRHIVTGRSIWLPLGTTANKMGRIAGANVCGARERFPGVVGTSAVRICGLNAGMTGLSERMARRDGFDAVAVTIDALDKARYFRGRPISVQLVGDRRSGQLLGGTVLSEDNVAGRIGIVATALHQRMLVEDFAMLDLPYAPPFSTVQEPLLIAAAELRKLIN